MTAKQNVKYKGGSMAMKGSWKAEFDRKYNRLMNMGSISVIKRANDILTGAIEGLDQLRDEVEELGQINDGIKLQEHHYNLKH